jgi:hypothetical protein
MTKPSPTDATTKLDAARKAVGDHIIDVFAWRSSLLQDGQEIAAKSAWAHINELRDISDKLDALVGSWCNLVSESDSIVVPPTKGVPSNPSQRAPNRQTTRLRIELPNNHVIQGDTAAATLVEFVRWVGVERVKSLNLIVDRQPFVSRLPLQNHCESSWKPVGDYYIETHSDTNKKRRTILKIAGRLNLIVNVLVI